MIHFYRIPLSALSLASILLLSACGGGGSGSSSGGTTTPAADTAAPTVRFNPSTLSVRSESTGTSTLTATDARGVTTGPTVVCTNGGSFNVATNTFTAAAVSADTTSVCTATAGDAAGNIGTSTLTVTMTPPDTSAPVITFTPATLTVASGSTGTATLNVVDAGGVSATPTASCTNGGSYDVNTGEFTPATVTQNTTSVCTITVTDDGGNVGTGTLTVTMTPAPEAVSVTLSGTVTYDRVPLFNNGNGLNYNGTFESPVRQAPVELVNGAGTVLQTTVSDDNGDYSFTVDSGQSVRVRVRAEIQKAGANEVDLQVLDNTSGNAIYAIQGDVRAVPTVNQTRDLNADSGWTGSSYTLTRAAAPFALLDTVYLAMEGFIAVDPEVDFPALDVLWSTRNRSSTELNVADGEIRTSSFTIANGIPVLRILGDANNDTDEYDTHVVVHEFGHYFESQLSRSDSPGGDHSLSQLLDPRLAFGEGWGNALSGMILEDPVYRDTGGIRQSQSGSFNVENNTYTSTGWYSEGSVQSILYDLFDANDDGADAATFGLGPIYDAFVDPTYKDTEAFTTIFAFLNSLERQDGVVASQVTAITDAQLITGTGQFGTGETNDGLLPDALPVYLSLPTDNSPVEFCSRGTHGEFNKHGNRRFFEFDVPAAGNYVFRMTRVLGSSSSNPEFVIFKDGMFLGAGASDTNNSEVGAAPLTAGKHVMEAYDVNVLNGDSEETCFTMRLEAQ